MTASERPGLSPRFESELREYLDSEAQSNRPDYLADVLVRSLAMRQRPAWSFPERWLPMSVTTTRMISPPRVPWRILVLIGLLLLALAGAALIAGSRPRLPAPYGRAANGLVAYAQNGDIYTVDPTTGISTAIVTGPDDDTSPVWSRDGTRLVFNRFVSGQGDSLIVANADGSQLVTIAPGSVTRIGEPAFSPDGRQILFTGNDQLWIANVDGTEVHPLVMGLNLDPVLKVSASTPSWLPTGTEVVFAGTAPGGAGSGIYAADVATGKVRTILAPTKGVGREVPAVSPDGRWIAYSQSRDTVTDRNSYQIRVVAVDGSSDRALPMPAGATFQDAPAWSNDGKRIVVTRGYSTFNQDMAIAILPADGSGVGVESQHGLTGCCDTRLEWAPADDQILVLPEDQSQVLTDQLLIDAETGVARPAPWAATSVPAWQRRAP
jgi:dipeptidyl aminopeptidase/acylaminoacyl peptidase